MIMEVYTYLAVDELDVMRALCIAVTSSIFGTSLVAGVLSTTTISVHLGEVKRAVKTTGKVGDVDIEGELLVLELEQHVVIVICQEVHARADVGLGASRDKFQGESIAGGGDAVRARVVGTVQSAVRGASRGVGAQG